MAKYTNIGTVDITVRGVTIKPGETKQIKGYANDRHLLRFTGNKPVDIKSKKKVESKPEIPMSPVESKPQANAPDLKKDDKQNK